MKWVFPASIDVPIMSLFVRFAYRDRFSHPRDKVLNKVRRVDGVVSMGGILDFVFARDSFNIAVRQPVLELVAHLGSTVRSRRRAPSSPDSSYNGEVDESGFAIRRVATHPKDSRAAVIVRGRFKPEGELTVVQVTVRHGRHMVFFSWLILLLASVAAVDAAAGTFGNSSRSLLGWALMAALAVLWHYRLYKNVQRIGVEVQTLLGRKGDIEELQSEQKR
jgi:hypothetical protein